MQTSKAGAQSRVPVVSTSPSHGGRRGPWGQARLVGAGEAGWGRRNQSGPYATWLMPEPTSTKQ